MSAPRRLVVSEIFGPTVQGEGPSAGRRCGFVRLGGCNLDCSWCDTPYTWDWDRYRRDEQLHRMTAGEVVAAVEAMGVDMLVVTGGEPMLQQEALLPVLREAAGRRWRVEVETNGTRVPTAEVAALVHQFTVSPKLPSAGVGARAAVRPAALAALRDTGRAVFKFVVTAAADLDDVDRMVADHRLGPVWVMPEGTDAARLIRGLRDIAEPAVARGYSVSGRLHVLIWGDERGR